MKKDIHPEYREVVFTDASANFQFITRSTVQAKDTIEVNGKTYPHVPVDISSESHPFFTGKMKFVDTAGRVEKFQSKFDKTMKRQKKEKELAAQEAVLEKERLAKEREEEKARKAEERAKKEEKKAKEKAAIERKKKKEEDKLAAAKAKKDADNAEADSVDSPESAVSPSPSTENPSEPEVSSVAVNADSRGSTESTEDASSAE